MKEIMTVFVVVIVGAVCSFEAYSSLRSWWRIRQVKKHLNLDMEDK